MEADDFFGCVLIFHLVRRRRWRHCICPCFCTPPPKGHSSSRVRNWAVFSPCRGKSALLTHSKVSERSTRCERAPDCRRRPIAHSNAFTFSRVKTFFPPGVTLQVISSPTLGTRPPCVSARWHRLVNHSCSPSWETATS